MSAKENPRLPRFGGSVPPPIRLSPPDIIVSVCYFPASVRIIILTELATSNLLLVVIVKGGVFTLHILSTPSYILCAQCELSVLEFSLTESICLPTPQQERVRTSVPL